MAIDTFLVAGARPNFMKVAPLYRAMRASGAFAVQFVHTGQHHDAALSDVFLRDLGLPRPDISLDVGSGSHGLQTARVLERFEAALGEHRPALVVVVGDVNSTLACALAASKTCYADGRRPVVAHVEAGLRSWDRTMPEEINRVVADAVSDLLFVTERSALANLEREGIDRNRVFFVGNVMIDTLLAQLGAFADVAAWTRFGVHPGDYGVVTLHRPSNVDDAVSLKRMLDVLETVARRLPLVFPVHPRTRARLDDLGGTHSSALMLAPPMAYPEFMSLVSGARMVLTDSGGLQEETSVLGVPCLTLRNNTERPVTVEAGTNRLVGTDPCDIIAAAQRVLDAPRPGPMVPELWDGRAAGRITTVLTDYFERRGTTARLPASA